jgi:hypothetical protein
VPNRWDVLAHRRGPWIAVVVAVWFGLVLLYRDFLLSTVEFNDRLLHETLIRYAASHWGEHWLIDHWFPSIGTGFPVFAHYPHLSHVVTVALSRLTPGVDPASIYGVLAYVLLALLPVLIFVSARRLGLPIWTSAIAALLYPLVRARPYFGIGWESYVHSGSGLIPQLWGVALFFPAVAWGIRAIRGGRWYVAGLLLAACALAHSLYGYMAALSLACFLLVPDPEVPWGRRCARLGMIGAVAFAATAYFLVPVALHADEVLRSQWEPDWKWDSIGLRAVLGGLARGDLFDGGRLPILTALVLCGVLANLLEVMRRRSPIRLWLLVCFAVWLLLFAGRATWGGLVDVLPMASSLHMHRFIGGAQIFGLVLAASGVELVARRVTDRLARSGRGRRRVLASIAAGIGLAALAVPVAERIVFMSKNDRLALTRRVAYERDRDFARLVASLRDLPAGRVHAGLHYDWGKDFRLADIPVYAHLQASGFDEVGFLFIALAKPGEWQVRLDYRGRTPYEVYDVRYIVAPAMLRAPPFARFRERFGPYVLYEVPTDGYFSAGRILPGPSDTIPEPTDPSVWPAVYRTGLRWLRSGSPEARVYPALEPDPPPPLPGEPSAAVIEEVGPGRYRAHVRAKVPTDLVLKATFHPNWRCTIDGRAARIYRVLPDFMAIRVEAGDHHVEFSYAPPAWKKVLFGLAVGLFALAPVVAVVGWRRPR